MTQPRPSIATAGQAMVLSAAGRAATLPAALVEQVAAAGPARPLPFAPPCCEGLTDSAGLVTPQFDLGAHWGGPPGRGRFAVRLRTARGPVRLRVEGVAFAGAASPDTPDSAWAEIEALVAGLAPATDLGPALPHAVPPEAASCLPFLLLRAGGEVVALPAARVERLARHGRAIPCRGGGPDERVVEIDGLLLPGVSLGGWLGRPVPPAAEPWSVVVRAEGRRLAITAEAVERLIDTPASGLRRLRHRRHDALHLLDPARGALPVLSPESLAGGAAAPPIALAEEADEPPAAMEASPADEAALRLRAGAFHLVLPAALVGRLTGMAPLQAGRQPGALPALDLARLLGGTPDATPGWLLLLQGAAARPLLALRVDAVLRPHAATAWQRLPALPPPLAALLEAVRPADQAIELLVRTTALQARLPAPLRGAAGPAFLGWLAPEARR